MKIFKNIDPVNLLLVYWGLQFIYYSSKKETHKMAFAGLFFIILMLLKG